MMWFVGSKENFISALNLLKYFHFNHVKGVVIFKELCSLKTCEGGSTYDRHMKRIWEVRTAEFSINV